MKFVEMRRWNDEKWASGTRSSDVDMGWEHGAVGMPLCN